MQGVGEGSFQVALVAGSTEFKYIMRTLLVSHLPESPPRTIIVWSHSDATLAFYEMLVTPFDIEENLVDELLVRSAPWLVKCKLMSVRRQARRKNESCIRGRECERRVLDRRTQCAADEFAWRCGGGASRSSLIFRVDAWGVTYVYHARGERGGEGNAEGRREGGGITLSAARECGTRGRRCGSR